MYTYQITMLYTLNIIVFIKYMSIKLGGLRNNFFLLRLWSSSSREAMLPAPPGGALACCSTWGRPPAPSCPLGSLRSQPQKDAQREELSLLWTVPFLMPEINLFCLSFTEQLFIECPPSARCLGCVRKLERQKQNKTVIEQNTIRKFEWDEFCAMGEKKEE